jgi:nitric oxide reductase subunit C
MPRQNLSDAEIGHLISFLTWVSNVDNQGWPPRPILVTGATFPSSDIGSQSPGGSGSGNPASPAARPLQGDENPIALGERLFRSATPACNACHSIVPGVNMAGPSLAGVAERGARLVGTADYKGKATDPAGYIRESIISPSAHIVPGAMYSANGQSFMPSTYAQSLKPEQLEQLAAYLSSLK